MVFELCPADVLFDPPPTKFSTFAEAAEQATVYARQHEGCWVRSWRSKELIALFTLEDDGSVNVLTLSGAANG